jgi:DNA-binding NarL/FixJ family response regulator
MVAAYEAPVQTGAEAIELRTSVLVVDPHPLIRFALQHLAGERHDLVQVGEAASADEAVALTAARKPDVVALSDTLPGEQSWQLTGRLRAAHPHLGIVVLGADGSDGALLRALDHGASAFVPRSAPLADLVAAIRAAAVAPASFGAAGLAGALRRRDAGTEQVPLSPRERQILFLLHDGLSVPEIAAQLYVSLSTAKTYVARLYEKLGARNRAQALMTSVRLGLFSGRPGEPDGTRLHAVG